jgi:hypothetical protein
MRLRTGSVWITWDRVEKLVHVEMVPSDEREESFSLFEFLSALGITAKQACQAYDDEDK